MGGESPAQILAAHLRRQGIRDEVVLRALIRVPRELFIAQELRHLAYEDEALPLEEGQTISQPIVVATMTEALRVAPGQRVLEVGTGSGYQAAVLAEMGAEVVTVERRPRLANQARVLLCHLGYHNVTAHTGDGTLGWPQAAPYDRIIVTAATPAVPPALLEQLRESGRLVAPVGRRRGQRLLVMRKDAAGPVEAAALGPVRFVPLIGAAGWSEEPSPQRRSRSRSSDKDSVESTAAPK